MGTTCKTCNRALHDGDADSNGNCVGCAAEKRAPRAVLPPRSYAAAHAPDASESVEG